MHECSAPATVARRTASHAPSAAVDAATSETDEGAPPRAASSPPLATDDDQLPPLERTYSYSSPPDAACRTTGEQSASNHSATPAPNPVSAGSTISGVPAPPVRSTYRSAGLPPAVGSESR
ncbi:MAG: hypothetical protein HY905_12920 [Deltaproteobacteria bacterium]|nr:hypothetical protein [Deltaproteobacteria bacterium]